MSIWHRVINPLRVALAAIFVIGLVTACAGGSQSTPPSTAPSASAKPSASASAPSSTQPIKLGAILTTSGPIGALGSKQLVGVEMAVEEINAAGGIMGRKVELTVRDDGGDPTKARTAAQELAEKIGATVIIGTSISSPALAVLPYLTEQKVVALGSFTADAANDPQKYPYGFNGQPTSTQQSEIVVKYAVEVLKLNKVGILAESGAYGNSTVPAFKAQLEKRGLQALATEQYAQGAQDMTPQLNNLKKAGVEAILAATLSADNVRIMKNMQSMGWSVPFVGNADLATSTLVEAVGADALKQVYAYNNARHSFSDKKPIPAKTKAFADKIAKRLNQNPLKESVQQQSLYYDLVYMAKAAMESTQSTDGAKIAAAIEQMKGWDGTNAAYTFTKDNHGGLPLDELVMVKAAGLKDGFFEMGPGY